MREMGMKRVAGICLVVAIIIGIVQAQKMPSQSTTIPDAVAMVWKSISHDFIALADAMPQDKWNFKPTNGAYTNVRTFAEQVKHVACANEAWAKQMSGEKPPKRCDLGGPNAAKSKAEIMAYLRESFGMLDKAIAATNENNLLTPERGRYWGDNRLSEITAAVWHMSDHYG
jgi:hypothetical protein